MDLSVLQSLDVRLWSLPAVGLLSAFLLVCMQRPKVRSGCPTGPLKALNFNLDINPPVELADMAWNKVGAWSVLRADHARVVACGKGTLVRRTIFALVYAAAHARRKGLRRVVIISTPVPAAQHSLMLSPRRFAQGDRRPISKRVPEKSAKQFARQWRVDSRTHPDAMRMLSPGFMSMLLSAPRHIRIGIANGLLSIAFEGSDERSDVESVVQLLPALADLLEETIGETAAQPVRDTDSPASLSGVPFSAQQASQHFAREREHTSALPPGEQDRPPALRSRDAGSGQPRVSITLTTGGPAPQPTMPPGRRAA